MTEVLEALAVKQVTPLDNRLIVRRQEVEVKSRGGIVIPDTAKEKPIMGHVVAVGTGKRLESGETLPMSVKLGDKILFGKYAGTEVKLGDKDEEYIVMREDDVIAIITE